MTDNNLGDLVWAAAFAQIVTNETEQQHFDRLHPKDAVAAEQALARRARDVADGAVWSYIAVKNEPREADETPL